MIRSALRSRIGERESIGARRHRHPQCVGIDLEDYELRRENPRTRTAVSACRAAAVVRRVRRC